MCVRPGEPETVHRRPGPDEHRQRGLDRRNRATQVYISVERKWCVSVREEMATPYDLSAIVNMIMQLLPVIIILAILPLFIRLFTGLFKE
jgi:hypothetical protein